MDGNDNDGNRDVDIKDFNGMEEEDFNDSPSLKKRIVGGHV